MLWFSPPRSYDVKCWKCPKSLVVDGLTVIHGHINGWKKAYTCLYIYINIVRYKNGSMGFQWISWRLVGLVGLIQCGNRLSETGQLRAADATLPKLSPEPRWANVYPVVSCPFPHWNRHDGVYKYIYIYDYIWMYMIYLNISNVYPLFLSILAQIHLDTWKA